MEKSELDLLDREERIFTCFQTAIDLLNPESATRNKEKIGDLLDFLAEEYEQARNALHTAVATKRGETPRLHVVH
jgi:hypothetical protein